MRHDRDFPPSPGVCVLTISALQVDALRTAMREVAIVAVAAFMQQLQPTIVMEAGGALRLRTIAGLWVDKAQGWHISSPLLMCELFRLRNRWGSFEDPASAWIVEVLEGPLPEAEKIVYLSELLHGA